MLPRRMTTRAMPTGCFGWRESDPTTPWSSFSGKTSSRIPGQTGYRAFWSLACVVAENDLRARRQHQARTFAAANPRRKEAVSSEKRPPSSPASTTKRALPPSPTNSGVRQPRPRASQCRTGSQHQGPYPARKRWFGPSHLPLDRFSQPRSPEGTPCVPTSQQQHTPTCDGQGCREDGHIGKRVL